MTDPAPHQQAFQQAQRAFANGWIDMEDLDRRLAAIARAGTDAEARAVVADLSDVEKRVVAKQAPAPTPARKQNLVVRGSDAVFATMVAVMAINILIWGVIALADEPTYFWPVWLLIPLGITGIQAVLARTMTRTREE